MDQEAQAIQVAGRLAAETFRVFLAAQPSPAATDEAQWLGMTRRARKIALALFEETLPEVRAAIARTQTGPR